MSKEANNRREQDTERFFSEVNSISNFVAVSDPKVYEEIPESWVLAITDVVQSTRAIEAGRYRDVNALGVASIVAMRNALVDVDIPYVFGGDGATIAVPLSKIKYAASALRGVQKIAQDAFGLELRAGIVPISDLKQAGHSVFVTRFQLSRFVTLAMFSGSGISVSEDWIKDPVLGPRYTVDPKTEPKADLSGFFCRWQPIPSSKGKFVSLLVQATPNNRAKTGETYRRVLREIEKRVGKINEVWPVRPETLRLHSIRARFEQEARMHAQKSSGLRLWTKRFSIRATTLLTKLVIRGSSSNKGGTSTRIREEIAANTDFRKFADTLRMVMDVDEALIDSIRSFLERERISRRLVYGLHTTDSALMTCMMGQKRHGHIHFVDGAEGGYTLAAKQMKSQRSVLEHTTTKQPEVEPLTPDQATLEDPIKTKAKEKPSQ